MAGGEVVEQVGAQRGQDLGGALSGVVGAQQALDLVGDMVVDGVEEEFGLAAVAGVDGAGGDAGPSGDLGYAGPLVALLGEDLGSGVQEPLGHVVALVPVVGSVRRNWRSVSHVHIIMVIIVVSSCRAARVTRRPPSVRRMGAAQEVGGSDTRVRLEVDGPIATITNDNVTKHNAFDDAMDARLFEILGELRENPDVRAVVWRGEGRSWSSGRDVSAIGVPYTEEEHAALMRRGHDGIQQVWDLDAPVFVAIQGWAIGGSFQRALLCDVRVAAEDARFMLPELGHGVIPDTGGMGVLAQLAGHGLVSDMVLTGRRLDAEEALRYGIVSRVVPNDELDATVYGMAEQAAAADPRAVAMARQVVGNLLRPGLAASMADERTFQTRLNQERGRGDRP